MKEKEKKEKKINLKEMWKDKKGRAKIELTLYGIFFLGIIIFVRVANTGYNDNTIDTNIEKSFIEDIKDNYEYSIEINIDNNIYKYNGKYLGHNAVITREISDTTDTYYILNNKYYILDKDGNYILTSKEEIYPYIDYNYLDINSIKEYINLSTKEDNKYIVKVSDIILNSSSSDNITIMVKEEDNTITIDYTNLFKENNKVLVTITYKNINNIISLEE